jgi:hypothetical protein
MFGLGYSGSNVNLKSDTIPLLTYHVCTSNLDKFKNLTLRNNPLSLVFKNAYTYKSGIEESKAYLNSLKERGEQENFYEQN